MQECIIDGMIKAARSGNGNCDGRIASSGIRCNGTRSVPTTWSWRSRSKFSNIFLRSQVWFDFSMNSSGVWTNGMSDGRPTSARIFDTGNSLYSTMGVSTCCGLYHQKKYEDAVDTTNASVKSSSGDKERPAAALAIDWMIIHPVCSSAKAFAKTSALLLSQISSRVTWGIST